MVEKVISGGQTGIDRMGLEVAKELGIPTGGTAPPNYWTEVGSDFTLRDFGVREIDREKQFTRSPQAIYVPRTYANASNSDGTVYFTASMKSKGLRTTTAACKSAMKPITINPSGPHLRAWIESNKIKTLNVAGNRGSKISEENLLEFRNRLKEALTVNGE